jgi:hypothetical protein
MAIGHFGKKIVFLPIANPCQYVCSAKYVEKLPAYTWYRRMPA